ncbi:MAG: FimV family protein [Betaproteobacteria bacterium]
MNRCPALLRRILTLVALLACGEVSALALGEVHSVSRVGERLYAQVNVIAEAGERIEAGCVHFRKPASGEGPWLDGGSFSVREEHGAIVLDIRSAEFIRDPMVRLGLSVGCGYGIGRDYTLHFDSRPRVADPAIVLPEHDGMEPVRAAVERSQLNHRRSERHSGPVSRDRVVVSAANVEVDEPGLRLALELQSWQADDGREAQRELLRMEYRLLQALHEQAGSQLDAAEKLRQMEDSLTELRRRNFDSAGRSEAAAAPALLVPASLVVPGAVEKNKKNAFQEWGLYGLVALLLLALAGLALWRNSERRQAEKSRARGGPPPMMARPTDETDDFDDPLPRAAANGYVYKGATAGNPLPVLTADVAAEAEETPVSPVEAPIVSTTVEEHYQVNPVMELADIMLSFGRVKGAAQALQEFIDHNPQEALQPWIRLMDVYRMAGMRSEFERVAADLNQHFNVEIQLWDTAAGAGASAPDAPLAEPLPIQWPQGVPKAKSIEEMEHVRIRVVQLWPTPECADYLNQLLRNNRGGLRTGLALPVVGEIMFLIDLLKSRADLESEAVPPG